MTLTIERVELLDLSHHPHQADLVSVAAVG